MPAIVRQALVSDVAAVAPLFDAYREFYGRASDLALAQQFLTERLSRNESSLLVAFEGSNVPSGFAQLFPSFSSVRTAPILVLNDLFVIPEARRMGIGRILLEASVAFARQRGAARLKLSTAKTNVAAQKLYESLGWERDTDFYEYNLGVQP